MSHQGRFGCRSMRRALLDYADGEQSATERFAFELHTEECAACRDAVGFHLKIEELLHRDAGIDADPGFEDRMVAGIRRRIAGQGGASHAQSAGTTDPDPLFGDADNVGDHDHSGPWFDEFEQAPARLRALQAEDLQADDLQADDLQAEESRVGPLPGTTGSGSRSRAPVPAPIMGSSDPDAPSTAGAGGDIPTPDPTPGCDVHAARPAVLRWVAAALLVTGSAVLYRALPAPDAEEPTGPVQIVGVTPSADAVAAPSNSAGAGALEAAHSVSHPVDVPAALETADEFVNLVPIGPGGDTELLFERLREAQLHVRDALVVACSAPDFRASFAAGVAALESERWPIENLVLRAIDDGDPAAANAAIRGAAELKYQSALPAIRRAARRSPTAATAMVSLGTLGDESMLKTMARNLTSPELSRAAFTGLARLGSFEAACAIAEHLTDPELGPEAAEALADLGLTGIAELMRAAAEGDAFSRDVLRRRELPTATQVATLLQSEVDPQVVSAAIRCVAVAGAQAVPGLRARLADPTFGDPALEALVSMVHPTAVAAIADAIERRDIEESVGHRAIRTSLELALDPGQLLAAAAREPGASARLLDAVTEEGGLAASAAIVAGASAGPFKGVSPRDAATTKTLTDRALPAVLADAQVPASIRAKAAIQLAGAGQLDAEFALGQCALLWAIDPDSAAVFMIAACRADISPELRERLQFLPRPTMKLALARADSIAERWGRTGPSESDIQRISRILQGAAPRV